MLTYNFSNLQGESMYAHLYKCIKGDITSGVLHSGDKLPSKRTLAKNLGISIITVENAYAQLVVEGYIYSLPKRGYYVAKIEQQALPPKQTQTKAPVIHAGAPAQLISFAKSSVPPDTFPYNIWARLLRSTLTSADEHALVSDTSAGGVLPLRQALAKHLYQFRGVSVNPEQIIIGAGTQARRRSITSSSSFWDATKSTRSKTPAIRSSPPSTTPTTSSAATCLWISRASARTCWRKAAPTFCTSAPRTSFRPVSSCP